jgi:tripartite-type tricarboxylate transporter receptor subunit TctC
MLRLRFFAALIGLLGVVAGISSAAADEPFYKGKRLTILINFAPGGPTDIEGRLLAKYLGRHLDGQPLIVVQNKDGAGGLVGTNYLGEVAPRDGSMAGYVTGAAWKYVTEPESQRVDFRSFEFLGYQPGNAVYYARADIPPGLRQPADILKTRDVVAGGLAVESAKDLLIRLTLDMLAVPYRYVTGYRSSATARLALERGEINLHAESTPSFFAVVEPGLVRTGKVIPLYYDPDYNGEMFSTPRVMRGSSIAAFPEFYRALKGTLPSGLWWDAYRTNLAVDAAMLRTVVMPPGSPPAAVEALRAALSRLNDDKDYGEEALRTIQFVPHYETGPDINDRVRGRLTVSPAIRNFVLSYMKGTAK